MIIKINITQQVIDYIKENISKEIWLVGEKIPSENKLTQILGVSRASVRIALQQFIALGILESFHGKGTFVVSNNLSGFDRSTLIPTGDDYRDMRQLLEFRRSVEPEASALAAERATEENIRQLDSLLGQMKQAFRQDDSKNFVHYDMMFHEEVSHASGNMFLVNCLHGVFSQKEKSYQHIFQQCGYKDGIYYHNIKGCHALSLGVIRKITTGKAVGVKINSDIPHKTSKK
jgi:GntR family transcriptional repressor for pyruvate dehydrogenase complex